MDGEKRKKRPTHIMTPKKELAQKIERYVTSASRNPNPYIYFDALEKLTERDMRIISDAFESLYLKLVDKETKIEELRNLK